MANHRDDGNVESFKARGTLTWRSEPKGSFSIHWVKRHNLYNQSGVCGVESVHCYDTIEHNNWHRTEKAALARVKVLIRQRQALVAREATTLEAMDIWCKAGRLPITRKR